MQLIRKGHRYQPHRRWHPGDRGGNPCGLGTRWWDIWVQGFSRDGL